VLEGVAAGAMLAMIAQTMLPEAYEHGGWLTGLMTVVGFLAAVLMGTLGR
jgi:ZIP family zinc transporter